MTLESGLRKATLSFRHVEFTETDSHADNRSNTWSSTRPIRMQIITRTHGAQRDQFALTKRLGCLVHEVEPERAVDRISSATPHPSAHPAHKLIWELMANWLRPCFRIGLASHCDLHTTSKKLSFMKGIILLEPNPDHGAMRKPIRSSTTG